MHITEGIITGSSAVAYTGAGLVFVGWGAPRMQTFIARFPGKKPLLGMGGALIFFISLIPIPRQTIHRYVAAIVVRIVAGDL